MAKKEKNILRDIMQYCAKSEHCTKDVLTKLRSWEVDEKDIDEILDQLRKENFLNDARYTNAYVADKWKLEHWGKRKIRHQLFLKNIDTYMIQKSLDKIDDEAYFKEMSVLLLRKEKELAGDKKNELVPRLFKFAVSRGFEEELIMKWLQKRDKG